MPIASTLHQPTLAGGEVSPSLFGRVDLARYQNSLRTCRNAFVKPEGGVSKRAGTRFIAETKFHDQVCRLIEFQFSTEQNFILEFGDRYMRIIGRDGLVREADKSVSALTVVGGALTIDVESEHGFSVDDHLYLSGLNGATELEQRTFKVTSVNGDQVTLALTSGQVLPEDITPYVSGGGLSRIYEIETPYLTDELFDIKLTQSADVLYLAHPNHPPHELSRFGDTNWILAPINFGTQLEPPQIRSATWSAGTPDGVVEERYVVTAFNAVENDESRASAERSVNRNAIFTQGETIRLSWTAVPGATDYNIYKELSGVFGYIATVSASDTVEEPLYTYDLGELGGVITGPTETRVVFEDDNITPNTADAPPEARNPFADGNHPGTVAFFQDRLAWAGSNSDPQTVWLSQSSNYDNHFVSNPPAPNDAVEFTINARQVNRVEHMLALRDLVLMTSSTIWSASGQGEQTPIQPASIFVRPQNYHGVETVEPVIIGDSALYVEDKDNAVRDLFYEFSANGYVGTDVSIMARHLFDGLTIRDWAYARAPDSIVWATRSDGVLLGLTYVREHQLSAWHRHDTDGQFESVAKAGDALEDRVYFTVVRNIEGREQRFIECMETRFFTDQRDAFFVDSGLSHKGAPIGQLGGLWHLEGKEVAIFADGNVWPKQTVANGCVKIAVPAKNVSVGLPFEGEIETLELNAPTERGPILKQYRKLGRVFLQVDKTRGIYLANRDGLLEELKERQGEAYGEPGQLISGLIEIVPSTDWARSARVRIVSPDPLPFEILSIMPEVAVAG